MNCPDGPGELAFPRYTPEEEADLTALMIISATGNSAALEGAFSGFVINSKNSLAAAELLPILPFPSNKVSKFNTGLYVDGRCIFSASFVKKPNFSSSGIAVPLSGLINCVFTNTSGFIVKVSAIVTLLRATTGDSYALGIGFNLDIAAVLDVDTGFATCSLVAPGDIWSYRTPWGVKSPPKHDILTSPLCNWAFSLK